MELGEAQYGVVSRRRLLDLGLTRSMVETRLRRGALVALHPGVYAVGHRQLRREGHWLAAVLWAGTGAALSHREAAAHHGLRASDRSRIDITTVKRMKSIAGVDVHHSAVLDAQDVAIVERIPVTTVERTLVDLATMLPSEQLSKALREAEHLRVVDVGSIEDALRRTRTRNGRGHATLRAVLEDHRRGGTQLTRSVLEDRFLALCKRQGLPRPRMNAHVEGMEVDALWPAHRLAIELDGWARHKDRHAFQHDRDKANALTQAGYRVLRFTHDDVVRRPGEIAARVAAFLAGA